MTEVVGNYETCREIELALSIYFDFRTHIIVPNITAYSSSDLWFTHEMDLCLLNERSMYASEVEIKISKSDLKRDANKPHHHSDYYNDIRLLWFAMPEKMEDCVEFVPIRAGILLIGNKGKVRVLRKPEPNKSAKKWPIEKAFKLARLGTMRIWNLKRASLSRELAKVQVQE